MFDFERLEVYQKAKYFHADVCGYLLKAINLDAGTKNQLRRASLSIVLNIAEGSSRFTKPDRKHFYIIARGSVFECVAIFDNLKLQNFIDEKMFSEYYSRYEELSRMIFAMIRNLS